MCIYKVDLRILLNFQILNQNLYNGNSIKFVCSTYQIVKKKTASIVIITHDANELSSQKCIKSFKLNRNIIKNPVLIRLF